MENALICMKEEMITKNIIEIINNTNERFEETYKLQAEKTSEEIIKMYNKIAVEFGFEIFNLLISNYKDITELSKKYDALSPFILVCLLIINNADEDFYTLIEEIINTNEKIAIILNRLMNGYNESKYLDECCEVFSILSDLRDKYIRIV